MTAEGNAVQDRLGETTDHATMQSPAPGPRLHSPLPAGEGRGEGGHGEGHGSPFLYASGARPLSGYTIKRGVGIGGFGEVYYAVSDAGKDVALKLIRRNLDTELRGMRQCLNLKHPNLLSLYDIRVDDSGDTWIVMEYVSGKSLEAELADHPQGLPPERALAWFRGIAAGVSYLHDHGIVHRDLKPGNIFSDEGVVKVGDYGLSKFISCSRRSGHTESIGTVHYMAPEVAHGRYGKELDTYALGAILFELLTGRVPFDGESVGEVLMKHLTAAPDVSKLAEPFRSVVAKALEKDPAKRFATVGEMLAAVGGAGSSLNENGGTIRTASPLPGFTFPAEPLPKDGAASGGQQPKGGGTCYIPRAIPVAQPVAPVMADDIDNGYEEPIGRAVRKAMADLRRDWQNSKLPSYAKIIILVFSCCAILGFSGIWIPVAMFLTPVYIVYWLVRRVYLHLFVQPRKRRQRRQATIPPQTFPQRGASPAPAPVFVVKPALERLRELVGSLLAAAAVTATMCVVMALIVAHANNGGVQVQQCAWLFSVGLAGAWIVLVTGKFWEGSEGEPMLRRFVLMTLGLGLGLAAFGAAQLFLVHLVPDRDFSFDINLPHTGDFYLNGQPLATAHMAAFAALLALVRWWRQASPLRSSRLSLGSIIVTVIAAHIVASLLQFPEPWLMMVAGCMSVAVQLASPWVPTYVRLRPQKKSVI